MRDARPEDSGDDRPHRQRLLRAGARHGGRLHEDTSVGGARDCRGPRVRSAPSRRFNRVWRTSASRSPTSPTWRSRDGSATGRPPSRASAACRSLQLTPLQLIVRTGSRDSRRSRPERPISGGPDRPRSGTPFTVALVLRAFGVPREGVRMVAAPFTEGRRCSATAAVDAMFMDATYPAENARAAPSPRARDF